MAMNYDRHVTAHQEFYQHLVDGDGDSAEKHREFYDEYLAVMDLTAEFYLQTVETVLSPSITPRQTAAMATGVAPRARQTAGRESAHSSESTSPVILGHAKLVDGSVAAGHAKRTCVSEGAAIWLAA
jgi:hypothetical protein